MFAPERFPNSPATVVRRDLVFRLAIDDAFPDPTTGVAKQHIDAVLTQTEEPSESLLAALYPESDD